MRCPPVAVAGVRRANVDVPGVRHTEPRTDGERLELVDDTQAGPPSRCAGIVGIRSVRRRRPPTMAADVDCVIKSSP